MKKFLLGILFAIASFGQVSTTINGVPQKIGLACSVPTPGVFHPECYTDSGSGNTLVSQADAAFNAAVAYVIANPSTTAGATVDLGSNIWSICNAQQGWVIPQSAGGSGGINIQGRSALSSVLSLTCTISRGSLPSGTQSGQPISQGTIWMPVYTTPINTHMHWEKFAVYSNNKATLGIDLQGLIFISSFEHITVTGAIGDGGSLSTEFRVGNASYSSQSWTFGTTFRDISTSVGSTTQGSGFTGTAVITSNSPVTTVVSQGNNYSANTVAFINGPSTGSGYACASMGSLTPTISSGHITAIVASGFFCATSPTIYVNVYDPGEPIKYGILFDHVTDSTTYDLQPQIGSVAAMYSNSNSSNNTYYNTHPCCGMPVGVVDQGTNNWESNEMDSIAQWGFEWSGGSRSVVNGTRSYWNGSYPGAQSYFTFSSAAIKVTNGVCAGTQTAGGYTLFSTTSGPNTYPAGAIIENEQECSATLSHVNVIQPWQRYNGDALVGNGLGTIVATANATNQGANVGSTLLYTTSATGGGLYEALCYTIETVHDGTSSTLPNCQITYTDVDTNAAASIFAATSSSSDTVGQIGALSRVVINAKASTAINWATTSYASNTGGTMKYAVHVALFRIGN